MSIYSNVTAEDLENLRKLAEQQKNQRALKIKNRILKQTYDIKLAESLSPITKKLDEVKKSTQESLSPITRKLNTINQSTQKVGDIIKESNFEKENIPSILLQDTFESLTNATNSLKLNEEDDSLSILGIPIKYLGGDRILVNDSNIYELTPDIHKALSNSSYTGESIKNENDRKNLYNFSTDIEYNGDGDEQTSQKKFFKDFSINIETSKKKSLLI